MTVRPALFAGLALTAAVLVACGPKQAAAPTAESPTAAPEAPAAPEMSDAQTKAALAALPAPYNTADLMNGHRQFAKCKSCHTYEKDGQDQVGPNLWGVVGRKAGGKADFSYSPQLKATGWTWDAAHLDAWVNNPQQAVPGSRMTFVGIRDAKDRGDLIAWLMVNTAEAPAAK